MCCGRASSRRLSCSARQVWVRQGSWSSTSCCARFRLCWSPEPDSLPTVSLQQSPCLPACSSCHTGSCAERTGVVRCLVNRLAASFCCSATCSLRSAGPATRCTHVQSTRSSCYCTSTLIGVHMSSVLCCFFRVRNARQTHALPPSACVVVNVSWQQHRR